MRRTLLIGSLLLSVGAFAGVALIAPKAPDHRPAIEQNALLLERLSESLDQSRIVRITIDDSLAEIWLARGVTDARAAELARAAVRHLSRERAKIKGVSGATVYVHRKSGGRVIASARNGNVTAVELR